MLLNYELLIHDIFLMYCIFLCSQIYHDKIQGALDQVPNEYDDIFTETIQLYGSVSNYNAQLLIGNSYRKWVDYFEWSRQEDLLNM